MATMEVRTGRGIAITVALAAATVGVVYGYDTPEGIPEALVPIVAVVRVQQLAHALALRLGYDPDSPQGLSKVTAT